MKKNITMAYTSKAINKNFRIKIQGIINGVKVNTLVGVSGLIKALGGSIEKLNKMLKRAFASIEDKCACKVYGGIKVIFYCK